MLADHLEDSRRLMNTYRYQGKIMVNRRSVAEHSWFVSKVAHALATWEKKKFGNEVDIEKVTFLAINHDLVEVYTGDIPSPTKSMTPGFRGALEQVEEAAFKTQIIPSLPKSWGEDYEMLHEEMTKLNTVESQIVKAADLIDRLFECMEEVKRQNKDPFEDIIREDLLRLNTLNLISVDYYLKYCLRDMGAYEYLAPEIIGRLDSIDFSPYF